jgi:hypothetical protein
MSLTTIFLRCPKQLVFVIRSAGAGMVVPLRQISVVQTKAVTREVPVFI